MPMEAFQEYILLTNFITYVDMFAEKYGVTVSGTDRPMQTASALGITIINSEWAAPWRPRSWTCCPP